MDRLSFGEYIAWHKATVGDDLESVDLQRKFDANVTVLLSTVNSHPFMSALATRLSSMNADGILQERSPQPEFVITRKPYDSVVNKLFRSNCLWNKKWPNPPGSEWVGYSNLFSRIDDILRTAIVSRYLDGPERITSGVTAAAVEVGLEAASSPRATESGYYAWHAYVKVPAQVIILDDIRDIELSVEFQATTQLQSVLRNLTHKFYEEVRGEPRKLSAKTRWEYDSPKFRGEYLGHTLHLVDAMILELKRLQEIPPISTAKMPSLDNGVES